MKLAIEWARAAERDRERLDRPVRLRVLAAIEQLAESGQGDVRRLRGATGDEYRLRVGQWRVRFVIDSSRRVLRVRRVLHRSAAYRR